MEYYIVLVSQIYMGNSLSVSYELLFQSGNHVKVYSLMSLSQSGHYLKGYSLIEHVTVSEWTLYKRLLSDWT